MNNENPYAAPIDSGDPAQPSSSELYFRGRGMYFWRIDLLKANLRHKPLSDRESLPYLIASVTLMTIGGSLPFESYNVWDGLGSLWSIALAILGTIYIFHQNGGSEGRYFLQRYFAIGWVVGIRCIVAIVACAIALFATLEYLGRATEETSVLDFVFFAAAEIIVYWRIGHHVHDLARDVPST